MVENMVLNLPIRDLASPNDFSNIYYLLTSEVLLNGPEQKFWKLLLQNDGSWFARSKLPLILGYASDDGLRHAINFRRMTERGLIETGRIGGKTAYRTNIRVKMA